LKKSQSDLLWISARPAVTPYHSFRTRIPKSGWTAGPAAAFFIDRI